MRAKFEQAKQTVATITMVLQEAIFQLNEYLERKTIDFPFKLNLSETEFQQKVWKNLIIIPFGKTIIYLE